MESLTAPRAPMPAASAASKASDSEISSAFARWKDAHAVREALPDTGNPSKENPLITVEEQAQWAIIDSAEQEIASLPAQTPAGVACKLWLAIAHDVETTALCEAAFRAAGFGPESSTRAGRSAA
ncbi:MAG: hypothetical protein EON56_05090 [Alphaproteobacteria bacterium]|nr:MAG: hypothetical protein EON56_05090 [Alphaproteobacteria bacterium]